MNSDILQHKNSWLLLYPFLFAVYPALELSFKFGFAFGMIARSLAIVLLFMGICMIVFYKSEASWERAAFVTTLLCLIVFYYGTFYGVAWNWKIGELRIGRHEILFPFWAASLSFLASRWVWRRFRAPQLITMFLSVTIVTAIVFSAGRYGAKRLTGASTLPAQRAVISLRHDERVDLVRTTLPDIYYIVPDSYARADVLEKFFNFDNADFLTALRDRGFYIADESRSNYVQTALSLASSLNMDFLEITPRGATDRHALEQLLRHSRVRQSLVDMGYSIIAFESGYPITELWDADVFMSSADPLDVNAIEGLLLINSVAVIAMDRGWLGVPVAGRANFTQVQYALEQLPEVVQIEGPKFVFVHIVSPHPPFNVTRTGSFMAPLSPNFGSLDGDGRSGSPEVYVSGYIEKLLYTNQMLLTTVDAVLAHSETPPIVVIQADHGSGMLWSLNSVEDTCVWERAAILNAYYLPVAGSSRFYPTITPVNTFRVIFDVIFETNLGTLEDLTYYSSWQYPYQFADVTTLADLPCAAPWRVAPED